MRLLKDIIEQKANELGGMAKLAKILNWGSEKNPTSLITKYINGKTIPSIEFGIRWKKKFDENLIDLVLHESTSMVEEPPMKFNTVEALNKELSEVRKELIECMKEKEILKNFPDGGQGTSKLKPTKK